MEFRSARRAILQLLRTVTPADLPALLEWMRTTRDFDEFTQDNNDILLKNIAEDLRNCLPLETMLSSEHVALQKIQQQPEPTVHVDAFLYDEDFIDSLCEEGKMSRNYCMVCGSHQTAPLGFISHSFSLMELKFIYHHVLPDLSGKVLVDVGSRLGTVLYGVKSSLWTYSTFGKYFLLLLATVLPATIQDRRHQTDFPKPNRTHLQPPASSVRLCMIFHYIPHGLTPFLLSAAVTSQEITETGY
ncbi:uncharacterized protein LOC114217799 isoform X2 [Eumetopias jubatus]|uniref:uncharacterized protein LOC114217799 isoform X2 n=1 Tax=Eumetopias jubatus TaxID=34886 RepID=UPI001016CE54|nr:uncharacterized protein LOC114217799 isoform X2 [Eumetopias jubatus]